MAAEEEADPVEPSSVPAWFREMVTDQRAGPFHQSELLYRQSLIANPCHAETWHLLGLIVHQAGHPEQGIAHLRQALALSPGNASYLHSLGSIYQEIGHYEQALPCYREVLRRDPTQLPAAQGLGMALKQVGRFDEALDVFGQILARDPLQPTVHNALGEVYQQLSRFPEALTHYRLASLTMLPFGRAHHDYLRLINYLPDWDADIAFDEHWLWGLKAAPRQPGRHPNPHDPERPLRIGYVSGDFRNHPRARFLASFLRHHNPLEFHAYLYAEVPRPDELTRQFQRDAPFWRNTVGQTPQEVARQIQSDAIDILIDLAGHHHYNRLDVFAEQPAPVQAAYLGYPNTTGLPAIDYWLTDSILLPPDAPIRTTEHPVYLPGASFCYEPPVSAPPVSPLPARRAGRITFGSNHDWSQLNDEVLPLWTRILQGVPDSRLIFLDRIASPQATEWLRSRFQRLGLAPERIEVRQPTRGDVHDLTVYGELDLILDTFPFSGHASTCEALWMGVPVVTLKGERIASRLSAAVLAPLGLTDLITETPSDYVERAQRLAKDLDGLEDLRQSLRRRMEPLCDGPRFTRQLEATYRQIWRQWCTGSSAEATSSARPRPSSLLKRESPRSNAPPKLTRLNRSRTIEIVVPVRPGGRDRFPIPDVPGRIKTRVQECADGNLSRLYRDAYLRSQADLVLLKHDDFGFEHWESFEMQMWDILTQHPILGVAGSRAFAPQRLPWWRQTAQPGFRDGLNRGMVSHPLPAGLSPPGTAPSYHQTLYGPPGPAAVLDGVLLAVIRRWEADTPYAGRFSHEDIASWWDESFGRHFYDMAFTFNASRAFQESGLKSACYAMVADVFHESVGTPDRAWQEAARLFVSRYGGVRPVRV